jgi:hypothetical protein
LHERESDAYQDEVYAFFLNCYHLKDWLKRDPSTAASVGDIESYISRSSNLSLCADLANASKHLELTSARTDADTAVGRRHYSLGLGNATPTTLSVRYEVTAGPNTYDAFELATRCITEWETYLTERGLLKS